MNITESIYSFFQKSERERENEAPEGLCPVCWGYQQYDGKVRDIIKDKQIDVNNHKDSYMLIQGFVKENLEGIKLKQGEVNSCPSCTCEDDNKLNTTNEKTYKTSRGS